MTDGPLSKAELRREAHQIAQKISDEKRTLSDGTTGWVGYDLTSHESTDGTLMLRSGNGTYSGNLSISLFMAGMYDTFGDSRYRSIALDATAYLLSVDVEDLVRDADLGAGDGVGGIVYGLSVLGKLLDEDRYVARALSVAETLTPERIRQETKFDLLLGTTGALTGLLRLYEQTGNEIALARADECGRHLVESRLKKWGYDVWDTHLDPDVQSFTTGFAHGAAGIANALYRLWGHTERDVYRSAADQAVAFENVFYSNTRHNWKANWSELPDYPRWWCYGTPGIGLARLGSVQYVERDALEEDVSRAASFHEELGDRDAICHGTFSQVEFLTELRHSGLGTNDGRSLELLSEAIRRKNRSEGYRVVGNQAEGLYNPSLFLGTAGIGYTILRALDPESLPCLLRYE